MHCIYCGNYFKPSAFIKNASVCQDCDSVILDNYDILDEEANLELELLTNRSGKIQPMIEEENRDSYDPNSY